MSSLTMGGFEDCLLSVDLPALLIPRRATTSSPTKLPTGFAKSASMQIGGCSESLLHAGI